VAAALVEGAVGLEQFASHRFRDDAVVDPNIAALLPRVHSSVRDDLTKGYPARWPTHVTVTLKDGTVERGMNDYPRGNPENPVSTADLEAKCFDLVRPRYDEAFAARALDAVRSLADAPDVRTVFDTLT
jgi:2-methylcitrate dehydratase PrpD